MLFSRRTFLGWVVAGLGGNVLGAVLAQDQRQAPGASQPHYLSPYHAIEDAAAAMQPGNADSVRALVDAVANFPSLYRRMPEPMAAVVKQRVINAQTAYLDGKAAGVPDGAVADAINALATAFETPDYGRVSLLMVQFFRANMAHAMPVFMRSAPDTLVDEPNPPMSPVQALFIMSLLIDQKLINPDYQAAPAEWDRDSYPRLLKEMKAQQELQRRIEAGEVQPKVEGRLVVSTSDRDIESLVIQRILRMSVADGLKLFNETFARLGIQ
jgi:hypothetical protein